jgi:perosamine synthetase
VKEFEDNFREVIGAPYPVAVNSCTSALFLAVAMAGIKYGDEVITTAQTMMATSHAIIAQQARPVFTDVQYMTGNIDPNDIEHRITERTKAILVVHWAGYPCDLDEIHAVASNHNLPVIEDAAHALGAQYKGRAIGSISPYTCFSFQATKHITTGDGGMLCLTKEDKYQEAKRRRWYGIDRINRKPSVLGEAEWNVTETGYKYHMNDIAASSGVEHLKELETIFDRRASIVKRYREELNKVPGIILFETKEDRVSANWLFTMHVEKRTDFAKAMHARGVDVSVVHLRIDRNDVFGGLRDDLPVLEKFTETHISIPLHNNLTDEEVEYVIKSIKKGW